MKTTVRYEKAIYAKLKILQLSIELSQAKEELDKHLTVAENKGLFDLEAASEVMSNMKRRADVEIAPANHVLSMLKHKDVTIYLHEPPKSLGVEALKRIIKER